MCGFLNLMLHQILCFVKFDAASDFMMPTSIVRCGLVTRQENEATRFPPKPLLFQINRGYMNILENIEFNRPLKGSNCTSLQKGAYLCLKGGVESKHLLPFYHESCHPPTQASVMNAP